MSGKSDAVIEVIEVIERFRLERLSMRFISAIVCVAATLFIASCNQRQPTSDVDPMLGRECFERHRASLPPGTQYEGVDRVSENRLVIKVMNGVDVVKVDCMLGPGGGLKGRGE